MHGAAGVIFVIVIILLVIIVIGFLDNGANLALAVVLAFVLAAIIGITVVVLVLAVIRLARDLLDRSFVMLVGRELCDTGQHTISYEIQRPLPAAAGSTTADECHGFLVLRR